MVFLELAFCFKPLFPLKMWIKIKYENSGREYRTNKYNKGNISLRKYLTIKVEYGFTSYFISYIISYILTLESDAKTFCWHKGLKQGDSLVVQLFVLFWIL